MLGLFRKKSLEEVLCETKKVKIHGVLFEIKRINPLNYLDGSKVLLQVYNTYSRDKEKGTDQQLDEGSFKKIKAHYIDVIIAGVVSHKFVRNENEEGVWVENIFNKWDMAQELYNEILGYTYGKKKVFLQSLLRNAL